MASTTFKTAYDENDGLIKTVAIDDNTLAPVTAADVREKYEYTAGGAAFATGARKLIPTTVDTSAASLKTSRRAEGSVTWSGGLATLALTVTGVAATDVVYAEIIGEPTETADLVSAVPTTNTITFTLSAANTSNDAVIRYWVYA